MISGLIKSIWKLLGNLRLSFYLLISASVTFVIGSTYTGSNYKFFDQLNEMRFQDWMARNFTADISITWWIPVLILILFLLGINTFVCSADRVAALIKKGINGNRQRFFHSLTPSLIHLLFITVMAGHGVTFVFGSWDRMPVKEGEQIKVHAIPEITVESIKDIYFPENTPLKNRILQTEVRLADSEGKTMMLSFSDHVEYGDYHLHLELVRKDKEKFPDKLLKKAVVPLDEKTCNKAPVYHISKPADKEKKRELRIAAIKDPGLTLIIPGFTAILILMMLYYAVNGRKQ